MKKSEQVLKTEFREIAIDSIVASATNPRKSFPSGPLAELAESIKAHGIKQPILVRLLTRYELVEPDLTEKRWHLIAHEPNGLVNHFYEHVEALIRERLAKLTKGRDGKEWEIVCGERRFRAAILAKLKSVPCMVEALENAAALEIQQIENLQREDLNPLEEAAGYKALMDANHLTVAQMCERLGRSRSHIFAKLALLKLAPAVRETMEGGKLDASIGELIGRLPTKEMQEEACKTLVKGDWNTNHQPYSFRQAKEFLEENYTFDLKKAKFDLKRSYAGTPHPGPCEACPRRSGNARDEFPDIKSPDVCMDALCYKLRGEIHGRDLATGLAGKGATVVPEKAAATQFQNGEFSAYHGEYERLEETTYQFGDRKSYAKLLGKAAPNIVMISPDGEAIRVFKKKDLPALLEAAGVKQPRSSGPGKSAAEKKNEALVKMRKEAAKLASVEIITALVPGDHNDDSWVKEGLWARLAAAAYHHTSIDAHAFVAKRRGLCKTQGEARDALEKLIKDRADNHLEMARLTVELLIGCNHGVSAWATNWGKEYTEICDFAGVDLKACEEAVRKPEKIETAKGTKDAKPGKETKGKKKGGGK